LMRCFANRTLGSVWKYGNERFQRKMRLQFFREVLWMARSGRNAYVVEREGNRHIARRRLTQAKQHCTARLLIFIGCMSLLGAGLHLMPSTVVFSSLASRRNHKTCSYTPTMFGLGEM
jgi:hypothetical protein